MKIYKASFLLIIILFSLLSPAKAQEWKVPDVKKKKTASFKFTSETVKNGETLFKTYCAACHGVPGKMSFAVMTPSPGDPATDKFQMQNDGQLYYKISNGRSPMPSFKNVLSDKERWTVISYFRSFNKKYIQPDTIPAKGLIDYIVELSVQKLSDSNKIKVTAIAYTVENPTPVKVAGADVSVFAQRTFGLLPLAKKQTTNKNGEAIFALPNDLPGDTAGFINLTVSLVDEEGAFGEGEAKIRLQVGKAIFPKSLTEERAMWNTRSKAPLWLIITYCSAILAVFGLIFYIITLLLKMKKIGIQSLKP